MDLFGDWLRNGGSDDETIDKIVEEIENSPKNKYDKTDAAEDTDNSTSKTSQAWHDARDDAEEEGEIKRR